jgi:N-acetyl-anhydromuramyl-L-alanine amidase AmpD
LQRLFLCLLFSRRKVQHPTSNKRAWHAGVSTWGNRSNLNDMSIGIEIVNRATDNNGQFNFPPYQLQQKGLPTREALLAMFKKYGYDITSATTEVGFQRLVRAFQLHFRATRYDGVPDAETAAILAALVHKYFPA